LLRSALAHVSAFGAITDGNTGISFVRNCFTKKTFRYTIGSSIYMPVHSAHTEPVSHEQYTSSLDSEGNKDEHVSSSSESEKAQSAGSSENYPRESNTETSGNTNEAAHLGDLGYENLPENSHQSSPAQNFFNSAPDRQPGESLGNSSPMEQIVNHLSPQDTLNLSLANKSVNAKLGQTGRQFMDAAYKNPKGNLPALLGKNSEPSEHAEMAYKMAGLDPQTKLQPHLGGGSLQGKDFRNQGGGFIGKHETPAQTQEELDAQNSQKKANHEKLLQENERKKQAGEPTKPVGAFKPKKNPTPAAPSGAEFEYHPGGGIHSDKIPSSEAMGGAYFKVDPAGIPNSHKSSGGKPKGSTESDGYRIARYGAFTTSAKIGHFYDNIPDQGADPSRKHSALSARDLIEKGSAAERNGDEDLAKEYQQEAQQRMNEKTV
jgi:hypothetical protein